MLSETAKARHLERLGTLRDLLEEAGLVSSLLEPSETIPFHILIAGFHQDNKGRDRFLHFSYLPIEEQEIQALELLQIYSTLPFSMSEGLREQVALLLLEVNTRLPIGHFGINEQEEIHYRYVCSLPAAKPLEAEEILDIVSMFMYMCDMFAEMIEHLATGAKDLSAVRENLR
jgi:hypothetical protein